MAIRRLTPGLLLVCIFVVLLFAGCAETLLGPEPKSDPQSVFHELWTEFDQRYAGFADRHIDWDSLYLHVSPLVTPAMPDSELMKAFDSLLRPLHDGHISVFNPNGKRGFSAMREDSSGNFGVHQVSSFYLGISADQTPSGSIIFGKIGDSIGYIYLNSFAYSTQTMGWQSELAGVLDSLASTSALVIDLRDNQGGAGEVETSIAGHFFKDAVTPYYSQVRTGIHHTDLSQPTAVTIEPLTPYYSKPIALLVSRTTMSAAEWFTLAMKVRKNTRIVGDTTQGAFSARLDRELSNGWLYSLSMERVTAADGVCYEGRGVPPDLEVFAPRGMVMRKDTVLDRAIGLLR